MAYKILIIDDDRVIRSSMAEYLTASGYLVDTTDNVKAAVSLMKTVKYDFVVMEVNLPIYSNGYSGRYLLNHIHYRYPWIKTIVVTGDSSIETGLEAIRLGASYWLTKPFSLAVLKNRISIILGLRNIRSFAHKQRKNQSI